MSPDRGCHRCGADTMADKRECFASRGEKCAKASFFQSPTVKGTTTMSSAQLAELGHGNIGHGHVQERPDGLKARCGGPKICAECRREAARLPRVEAPAPKYPAGCREGLRLAGKPYPRTCSLCGPFGKCNAAAELPKVEAPPIAPTTGETDECACHWCTLVAEPAPTRTIIGFVGLAGSGKSTAAKRLVEQHKFTRGRFAGALKDMLRAFLRYRGVSMADADRMVDGDLKEVPHPALAGRTPRHAMQTLGTEWGRDCMHPNLWVDTELDARQGTPRLVFDDVRFPNEVEAIKRAGGVVVRVERAGAGQAAAGHVSEQHQLRVDAVVPNNGSMGVFLARIDKLV